MRPGDDARTCIVNTAGDHWRYSLGAYPDLDPNVYGLAGIRHRERGCGIASDMFPAMEQLRPLGEDPCLGVGDSSLQRTRSTRPTAEQAVIAGLGVRTLVRAILGSTS